MKLHFIGIGGIGVSALARYFLEKGYQVSGSDLVSSEITETLKKLGVKILVGVHNKKCLTWNVKQPDLVIYSPAVQKNNPELKAAKKLKIKCLSYPQALGELTKNHFTIAVCGSHGKSTVAAMIGVLLKKAGFSPTVILGTKVKEFGDSNCRVGNTKYLVIEADEHFASFLNYWPKIIVLTNVEADHLDFYKNLKNILRTFRKFVSHLPENGILIANKDDKRILRMLKSKIKNPYKAEPSGFRQKSKIQFKIQKYSLRQNKTKKLRKILKIPGEFNVSNALAALTLARVLKIPDKISFKALSEYRGSWRRFDIKKIRINNKELTIIDDYAHHPTQIKVTLEAAREKFPRKKIWCVFQPHQYQRTYYLWNDFVKVLSEAPVDKLIITDIYDVAGREDPKIKKAVSSEKLVREINKKIGHNQVTTVTQLCPVMYIPNSKEVERYLKKNLKGGEVVLIMGAGDIYEINKKLKPE
ncbi:UDP-N-acetylmuramate--L-alanine ligase [Candidatus Gracilibacteria bacterium]|nr:UDP-N-acetylmuramate--L-alanine ligase [Candidatus Gracilibacteria bacterium]